MSEREIALKSKAYQKLRSVYQNRDQAAKEWIANKGKVIGTLGSDVPDELIIAAKLLPIRVCGDISKPVKLAMQYLDEVVIDNKTLTTTFEKLIDGTYFDILDHVVLSKSTALEYTIYLILKEMRRIVPELNVPPAYFIDYVTTRSLIHQKRNIDLFNIFKRDLESWIGNEIKDEAIREAIGICNANRQVLREFDVLRNGSEIRVNGTEALTVIGASLLMDKNEHTELVRQLIEEAKNWPVIDAPRIFVSGSDLQTTELYELVEKAGGVVVSEDNNWGARHYDTDVTYDLIPVNGIVERYMNRMSNGKVDVNDRVGVLKDGVTKYSANAAILYLNINDDGATWDFPGQKKMLSEMGIPYLKCWDQTIPIDDKSKLLIQIEKLVKSVKGGK